MRRSPTVWTVVGPRVCGSASGSALPERCVEAYYLQRTRFASIAERKLRWHQLTEDGNVEIGGRDLSRAPDEGGADRRGASQIDPKPSLNHADKLAARVVTRGSPW